MISIGGGMEGEEIFWRNKLIDVKCAESQPILYYLYPPYHPAESTPPAVNRLRYLISIMRLGSTRPKNQTRLLLMQPRQLLL